MGLAAQPAQAADSWVYVVVKDRVCSKPGYRVFGILANVQPTGWSSNRWDNGDNIIYPKVRLYQRNAIRIEVRCAKRYWWGWWSLAESYYKLSFTHYFTPTKPKQTIWIG